MMMRGFLEDEGGGDHVVDVGDLQMDHPNIVKYEESFAEHYSEKEGYVSSLLFPSVDVLLRMALYSDCVCELQRGLDESHHCDGACGGIKHQGID